MENDAWHPVAEIWNNVTLLENQMLTLPEAETPALYALLQYFISCKCIC